MKFDSHFISLACTDPRPVGVDHGRWRWIRIVSECAGHISWRGVVERTGEPRLRFFCWRFFGGRFLTDSVARHQPIGKDVKMDRNIINGFRLSGIVSRSRISFVHCGRLLWPDLADGRWVSRHRRFFPLSRSKHLVCVWHHSTPREYRLGGHHALILISHMTLLPIIMRLISATAHPRPVELPPLLPHVPPRL